ncbi:hypothetical protein BaRGS_00010711 [Batillaria attramentaria]|uniref:Uncharacterized protein n=1 Tax=Batillaria attramentaria TaxID=370345 RepID=A0ABD0LG63_9CAEN
MATNWRLDTSRLFLPEACPAGPKNRCYTTRATVDESEDQIISYERVVLAILVSGEVSCVHPPREAPTQGLSSNISSTQFFSTEEEM